MSSKELKKYLKLSKECMDKREYVTALQHCKNALKIDDRNYMALVLFGACQQETDEVLEAPQTFQKAIAISPELPLAWKGLSTFYEKQNRESDRVDLLNAYVQLFKIEQDLGKLDEWGRKIEVLLSLLDHDVLLKTWNELMTVGDEKINVCFKVFFSVIGAMDESASEPLMPILKTLISKDWGENGRLYTINIYKKYLKLLFQANMLDLLLKTSKKMYDLYPDVVAAPEWFCKAYLEAKFGTDFYDNDIPEPSEMYMVLLNLVPSSYLGYVCKGVDELACREFVAACDSLTRAVQLKPTYGIAWYLLTQGQVWVHRFSEAESSARQALQYWKLSERNVQSINNCKYWLAKALCELNEPVKWEESLRIADEFLYDSPNKLDFLPILIKVSIKLNDGEKYEKYMELLNGEDSSENDKKLFKAMWLKQNNVVDGCYDLLVSATQGDVKNYEIWLELGKLEFDRGNMKEALSCFLKSTKLNEWCSVNYRYLGHIYRKQGNLARARRCYQKGFQLSSLDFESGIGLSDVFRILGMEEENLKLLTAATQVPGARWAWLKMGLHYLSVNKPAEAVNSLRVAVRLDSSDHNVWESLGDAYLALGSYTAAMKSYQQVLELQPELVYPLLQIAVSKHLQEQHEEAVLEFRQVLQLRPDFLPALNSHAVACLALMRERMGKHLNGLAADSCQEAVSSLARAVRVRKDLRCVWKSLGDACVMISKFPTKYCKLTIPVWLWIVADGEQDENIDLKSKADILSLGIRCYCNAIALSPKLFGLWYDLAVCYNCLADALNGQASARNSALLAVKKSLMLKNDSWAAWNLLGVLSMAPETKNLEIAQHAFSKAIQSDGFNAVPWSNLGTLYFLLNDLALANQCFTEAQRYDHDNVQCWIGQAMLAEATGHAEAMDLYRHSTQLGFHPEGALGYSTMVLGKILKTVDKSNRDYIFSIKNMNAEVLACDALTWYTDRFPNNACAYNMLGLLLERLRLYKSSEEAFANAFRISPGEHQDKIRINYGRVLNKLGKTERSIEILKDVKEVSFESLCLLAAALIKNGELAAAYETYEKMLESIAQDDEQKSHILIAMAGVLYQHQAFNDAKVLLMQACVLPKVPVAGLFACCSLGILHSDMSLTDVALNELRFYKDDPKYLANIALLEAYADLIKGNAIEAQRGLCKAAHQHPEDAMVWLNLGLLHLLLHPDGDPKAATKCFSRALQLGRSSIDVSKVASLMSLGYLLSKNGPECLRVAQKAVQLFPSAVENWLVLLAALYGKLAQNPSAKDVLWLKKRISRMEKDMTITENLSQWLKLCEEHVNLLVAKII